MKRRAEEGGQTDLGVLIRVFRAIKGWKQTELARRASIDNSQVSRYESGDQVPQHATYERLRRAAGVSRELEEFLRGYLQIAREMADAPSEVPIAGRTDAPGDAILSIVKRAMLQARTELRLVRQSEPDQPRKPTEADLARVDALWRKIESSSRRTRRLLVKESKAYREWLLAVRLCDESTSAAASDPKKALELAEFAVHIAQQVPGPEAWRSRLEGYCLGFVANAYRVANRLDRASATFQRMWLLWEAGEDEASLLSAARLLGLEATLLGDERRLPEALTLHSRAWEIARPEERGHLLLKKAHTLEVNGDYEAAIEALGEATPIVDGQREPRLYLVLHFNMASNLCRLGRAAEAAEILPEVRKRAHQLRNDLDVIRALWLEGNVAAGLGEGARAEICFNQVRGELSARGLPYDYALASLDLALLYLGQERFVRILGLAQEMLQIFQAHKIHPEALAALSLFIQAAERESVTLEVLRRLQTYLREAQRDPALKFTV